ncbi:MAG: hypothetical protein WA131_08285 [Desulfitobacteriaceae bacterium]
MTAVEQLQNDFGMYQSILETDPDYVNNYGKSYAGVTIITREKRLSFIITNLTVDGRINPMEQIVLVDMPVVRLLWQW